jgi:hypothetical protein
MLAEPLWCTEYLPFIYYWEYSNEVWKYIWWPLNMGSTRDIPTKSVFHHSLIERLQIDPRYQPKNAFWVQGLGKQRLDRALREASAAETQGPHATLRLQVKDKDKDGDDFNNTYVVVGPSS